MPEILVVLPPPEALWLGAVLPIGLISWLVREVGALVDGGGGRGGGG